ncbi:MAG TPA: hypothetical protein VMG08_12990 [Allosphingosinicella sp.]|nr:hypothetical protein [Allosphingosinicella sp.]
MSDFPSDPLAFTPVPSARTRHDGWTAERQRGFIHALSKIGVVAFAAECVGMSRKSAYALLKRAGPESGFARAWREALMGGRANTWFETVRRAVEGVEEPYFYRGIQRGTRRVYNDKLLIAAFRAIERVQGADPFGPDE